MDECGVSWPEIMCGALWWSMTEQEDFFKKSIHFHKEKMTGIGHWFGVNITKTGREVVRLRAGLMANNNAIMFRILPKTAPIT